MIPHRLTRMRRGATAPFMEDMSSLWETLGEAAMRRIAVLAGFMALSACINVNAPAEPIVIELNINIKQEVLYRLVDSAEQNIEANPEIF
ncbi:hypothetical protein GCM10010990_27310 [Croceicoccus mobilis]|uniref:YnbE-like lipoprotein n=2 Tax=Croceicoccus mobilis TaxID=1703339 RepID=A0A916Z4M4_9SPHN|nr:hypothetical protein GCM10010990_27310 [Croceicoccus mobilis]